MSKRTATAPVIGFIDIDSFECQLWQRTFPEFWGRPCVVVNQSGRILSVTNEAKKLGVSRSLTPFLYEAREVCPTIHAFTKPNVFGKPDSKKTREGTWEVLDIIKEYCDRYADDIIIEMASSDEFYLDLSSEITRRMERILRHSNWTLQIPHNTVHERSKGRRIGPFEYNLNRDVPPYYRQMLEEEDRLVLASVFMSNLCDFLYKKTDLSASAGVGNSKLLAKVGCGINRPRKVTIFHKLAFPKMSEAIPIKNIPGLGGLAGEELMKAFKITQVSELRRICLSDLEAHCATQFDPPNLDLAKRIFSSARGNDDQPVVQKLMKPGIVVNKPCGDVRNMEQLRLVVWNLSNEILCRLEEEKIRHKRRANQVRFGFTFEAEEGVNILLEVKPYTKPHELCKQGLEFVENQPGFNPLNFKIVELKYSVQEFWPLDNMEALKLVFQKLMDVTPKNYLPVNGKSEQTDLPLHFTNLKHIGTFRSKLNGRHSTSYVRLPKLVSMEQLYKLKGYNLGRDYESHPPPLFDYNWYTELKHRAFIRWLKDIKFMESVKSGIYKKPDFIGFSGRFTSTMRSPAVKQFADWEIYASNVEGIIYLWEERRPEKFEDQKQTYCGQVFEKLAVKGNSRGSRYEMAYVVNEMTLDQHQILVVGNVDAADSKGNWYEISTWKTSHSNALFGKMLRAWTECSVQGVSKLVLGTRNDEAILEDIKIKSIQDLANFLGEDDTTKCMNFENRLLSYIKAHLPISDPNVVKKFSWTCGNRNVSCVEVQQQGIPNLILSRLYSSYFNDCSPKSDEEPLKSTPKNLSVMVWKNSKQPLKSTPRSNEQTWKNTSKPSEHPWKDAVKSNEKTFKNTSKSSDQNQAWKNSPRSNEQPWKNTPKSSDQDQAWKNSPRSNEQRWKNTPKSSDQDQAWKNSPRFNEQRWKNTPKSFDQRRGNASKPNQQRLNLNKPNPKPSEQLLKNNPKSSEQLLKNPKPSEQLLKNNPKLNEQLLNIPKPNEQLLKCDPKSNDQILRKNPKPSEHPRKKTTKPKEQTWKNKTRIYVNKNN